MTEAQAIELLEELGYTITQPAQSIYISHGEMWENVPKLYRSVWGGDKASFSRMLDAVDVGAMVARWADETLRSVVEFGSDLAFNRKQLSRINAACRAELAKRYPAVPRATNGMTDD